MTRTRYSHCVLLLSLGLGSISFAETKAGSGPQQSPGQFGIAALLSFAPKELVDSVREGSQEPAEKIPARDLVRQSPAPAYSGQPFTGAPGVVSSSAAHKDVAATVVTVPAPQVAVAAVKTPQASVTPKLVSAAVPRAEAEGDLKRIESRLASEQAVSGVRGQLVPTRESKPTSRLLASIRSSQSDTELNRMRKPASREDVMTASRAKATDLQAVLAYHLAPRGSSKQQMRQIPSDGFETKRTPVSDDGSVARVRVFTEISSYAGNGTRFRRVDGSGNQDSQSQPNDSVDLSHHR